MDEKYTQKLDSLAKELVTPQRYSEVNLVAELAIVKTFYPDIPQAAIYYFPDRSGDSVA